MMKQSSLQNQIRPCDIHTIVLFTTKPHGNHNIKQLYTRELLQGESN